MSREAPRVGRLRVRHGRTAGVGEGHKVPRGTRARGEKPNEWSARHPCTRIARNGEMGPAVTPIRVTGVPRECVPRGTHIEDDAAE
jgi:hypothetical protein